MSVRNIREHQARGLLQAPDVRARIGYYGPDHLARLKLITDLQAEGFNLKGIKRLLEDAGGVTDRLAAVHQAVIEPFETEQPQVLTVAELEERFGSDNVEATERAIKLGALIPLGDGRFEAPSPSLIDAAEEVVKRGVPAEDGARGARTDGALLEGGGRAASSACSSRRSGSRSPRPATRRSAGRRSSSRSSSCAR